MTEKKRKLGYWGFKASSVIVSCLFPLYAVYEHFPLWVDECGSARSLGSGIIISAIVMLIIFRKTVFDYIEDKIKGKHAPPITVWVVLLVVVYVLIYINKFLADLAVVLWMGLLGCLIGTSLTWVAEHKFAKREDSAK